MPFRLPNIDKKTHKLLDPHVVIIGAGASLACCQIDKNGKELPLLKNIHKVLGLTEMLKKYNFNNSQIEDFEKLYSSIYGKEEYQDLQTLLENSVRDYFSNLEIPDEPTIYDYLILSLTSKDAIISFNWDPLLLQAYLRNRAVGNLPQLVFPHGNVGVGLCYDCYTKGYIKEHCKCGKPFTGMKLLYPIGNKNYQDNDIIENEWTEAKNFLSRACGLTIFGYGVPESDSEVLNLIRTSFDKSNVKEIAPFTIINLKEEEKVQKTKWESITATRVYSYCERLEDSILWKCPRVSLETFFDAILQQQPRHSEKEFKHFASLEELQKFVLTINEFEMRI